MVINYRSLSDKCCITRYCSCRLSRQLGAVIMAVLFTAADITIDSMNGRFLLHSSRSCRICIRQKIVLQAVIPAEKNLPEIA